MQEILFKAYWFFFLFFLFMFAYRDYREDKGLEKIKLLEILKWVWLFVILLTIVATSLGWYKYLVLIPLQGDKPVELGIQAVLNALVLFLSFLFGYLLGSSIRGKEKYIRKPFKIFTRK